MRTFATTLLLLAFTASAFAADTGKQAGDATRGKAIFLRDGCYECHGTVGQGGVGPKLGPDPIPFDAMNNFVRTTKGEMPAFSRNVLSDAELLDIHAYLASVPKPPDVKTIPILND